MSKYRGVPDPKVRVFGNYNIGAAFIQRGRNALVAHLQQDDALGIKVSRRNYTFAPGVVATITHEFDQTYLYIYAAHSEESLRRAVRSTPAYIAEYYNGAVDPTVISSSLVVGMKQFGLLDFDGNLMKPGALQYSVVAASDLCDTTRLITVGRALYTDANYSVSLVSTIDGSILGQVPVPTNSPTGKATPQSIKYMGNNTALLFNFCYYSTTTPEITAFEVWKIDLADLSSSLAYSQTFTAPLGIYDGTALSVTPPYMCVGAGDLSANGYRNIGFAVMIEDATTATYSWQIYYSTNGGSTWAMDVSPTGFATPAADGFLLGFDYAGNYVLMAYQSPQSAVVYIYSQGSFFNANLDPQYPAFLNMGVGRIVPYQLGVLISMDCGMIYFHDNAIWQILSNDATSPGAVGYNVVMDDGNSVHFTNSRMFRSTKSRGYYNVATAQTADFSNGTFNLSPLLPTSAGGQGWGWDTHYNARAAIINWYPIFPGDWLDYPSLHA